VVLVVMDYL